MSATILRGDAGNLPLPDGSVDLVVTSPPYFALRSYTDGGEHYDGQIGSEATPAEYITALIGCTREWVRVLKPSGSIFVNLGDKYSAYGGAHKGHGRSLTGHNRGNDRGGSQALGSRDPERWGVPAKSLMMLPERYRIAAVDDLGLIARAVVVWSKPNGLPESVTDRVRRSHEDWVHLVKQPRYFSAVDAIRTPASDYARPRNADRTTPTGVKPRGMADGCNPLGALPGSVWEIPTEPLNAPERLGVDHFAAFPTEWPRRIILGWSPSGICTGCGEGRRPVVATEQVPYRASTTNGRPKRQDLEVHHGGWNGAGYAYTSKSTTITGEACACAEASAQTRPAVVLDPFGGTGTTALVASVLGRHGISVDMSADYCRLATWRTTDPGQRARAMRVEKPPAELPGQGDLFAALSAVAS